MGPGDWCKERELNALMCWDTTYTRVAFLGSDMAVGCRNSFLHLSIRVEMLEVVRTCELLIFIYTFGRTRRNLHNNNST